MKESKASFHCASYVHLYPKGPLFITAIVEGKLRVVTVLYGTEHVRAQLLAGATLDAVVASMKTLQRAEISFPISRLRKIVWSDFTSNVVFTYDSEHRSKRTTTQIAADHDRERMLLTIQESISGPVRCFDESAGILAVAWSRFLGAAMALAGTIVLHVLWDPARIARVRGGTIALLLGRTGCAVVGIAVLVACCVSAWLAIRKRSRYYIVEVIQPGNYRQYRQEV